MSGPIDDNELDLLIARCPAARAQLRCARQRGDTVLARERLRQRFARERAVARQQDARGRRQRLLIGAAAAVAAIILADKSKRKSPFDAPEVT